MKPFLIVTCVIALNLAAVVSGECQTSSAANTAPLRGRNPFFWNVLPDLPPTGFHAHCRTPAGVCLVQGNAPIAPGSTCHCGEHAGRTV